MGSAARHCGGCVFCTASHNIAETRLISDLARSRTCGRSDQRNPMDGFDCGDVGFAKNRSGQLPARPCCCDVRGLQVAIVAAHNCLARQHYKSSPKRLFVVSPAEVRPAVPALSAQRGERHARCITRGTVMWVVGIFMRCLAEKASSSKEPRR